MLDLFVPARACEHVSSTRLFSTGRREGEREKERVREGEREKERVREGETETGGRGKGGRKK